MIAFGTLVLVFLQPLIIYNGGPPVGSLAVAGAVVFVLLQRLFAPGSAAPLRIGLHIWVAAGILCWAIAVTLVTGRSAEVIYEWLTFLVAFVIGQGLLRGAEGAKAAIAAGRTLLALSVIAVAIETYISPTLFGLTMAYYGGGRVPALHYNANGGALFLLMALAIVSAGLAFREAHAVIRTLDLALLALGLWAMLRTGSRAGIVAAVVVFLLALILARSTNGAPSSRTTASRTLIITVSLALLAFLISRRALPELSRDVGLFDLTDRGSVWNPALSAIREHPLWGPGPVVSWSGIDNPHNVWLEIGLALGLPGIALFAVLVLLVLASLATRYKTDSSLHAGTGILLLLGILTYTVTHSGAVSNSMLWLIISAGLYQHSPSLDNQRDAPEKLGPAL